MFKKSSDDHKIEDVYKKIALMTDSKNSQNMSLTEQI